MIDWLLEVVEDHPAAVCVILLLTAIILILLFGTINVRIVHV